MRKSKKDRWRSGKIARIIAEQDRKKAVELMLKMKGTFIMQDDTMYVNEKQLDELYKNNITMAIPTD